MLFPKVGGAKLGEYAITPVASRSEEWLATCLASGVAPNSRRKAARLCSRGSLPPARWARRRLGELLRSEAEADGVKCRMTGRFAIETVESACAGSTRIPPPTRRLSLARQDSGPAPW